MISSLVIVLILPPILAVTIGYLAVRRLEARQPGTLQWAKAGGPPKQPKRSNWAGSLAAQSALAILAFRLFGGRRK